MSEAAVAEPEVQTPTEELSQEPTKTAAEPTSVNPEGSESQGTDSDPVANFQAEWNKAVGVTPEAATPEALPKEPELPVETIDQARDREAADRHRFFTDRGERGYVASVTGKTQALATELDLTSEQSQRLMKHVFDELNILHGMYDSYSLQEWKNAALQGLPKEAADKLKGLNLTTRKDHYAAAYSLGAQDKDAEYKAKFDSGDFYTKAQMEAGRAAAQRMLEAGWIKDGRLTGTSSGESVRGEASGLNRGPTVDEALNLPVSELQKFRVIE